MNQLTIYCPHCEGHTRTCYSKLTGCYVCVGCMYTYLDLANNRKPQTQEHVQAMLIGQHWKVCGSTYQGTSLEKQE